ncbi:hypothetical protein HanRHA438_Chr04g0187241 [Helianthus annuus]|nr:hypothetical protein HanRHA438_Chr04g0187241 [Helianthus annuus]
MRVLVLPRVITSSHLVLELVLDLLEQVGLSTKLSCSFTSISLRGTRSDSSARHFLRLHT